MPDTEVISVAAPPPVFVDSTGRRGRLLRRLAYAFGALVMLYGGLISVSLAGGPVRSSAVLPLPGLEPQDDPAPGRPNPIPAPTPSHAPTAPVVAGAATGRPAGAHPAVPRLEATRISAKPRPPARSGATKKAPTKPKPASTTSRPAESTTAPAVPTPVATPRVTTPAPVPPVPPGTGGQGGGETVGPQFGLLEPSDPRSSHPESSRAVSSRAVSSRAVSSRAEPRRTDARDAEASGSPAATVSS
jgi:hypothetical protein